MKACILWSLLISMTIFPNMGMGNFSGNYETIHTIAKYTKPSGSDHQLTVIEQYQYNPFANSVITRQQTDQVTRRGSRGGSRGGITSDYYVVDNRTFMRGHPLYFQKDTILQPWGNPVNDSRGNTIWTAIMAKENSYSGVNTFGFPIPDQSITVRKFYAVTFSHDTTPPTCGGLNYFQDEAGNIPDSYTFQSNVWRSTPLYHNLTCGDPETGCRCNATDVNCITKGGGVYSPIKQLGHLSIPSAYFFNNVNLLNRRCTSGNPRFLFDPKAPSVEVKKGTFDFRVNNSANIRYETDGSGKKYDGEQIPGKVRIVYTKTPSYLSDTNYVTITYSDTTYAGSLYGVSGLRHYTLEVTKIADGRGNPLNHRLNACSTSWYAPNPYNPNGDKTTNDTKSIPLNQAGCEASKKTGVYQVVITGGDFAGNETKLTFSYTIHPGVPNIANSSLTVDAGSAFANNSDAHSYTVTLKDVNGNAIYSKGINSMVQSNLSGVKLLKTNMITTPVSGSPALNFYDYLSKTTDENGSLKFKLKSLAPGEFSQWFTFTLNKWDNDYRDLPSSMTVPLQIPNTNHFLKPIVGVLQASDDGTSYTNVLPKVGTVQKYRIKLTNTGNLLSYSNGKIISIGERLFYPGVEGHVWQSFGTIQDTFANNVNTYVGFTSRINATKNILITPTIIVKPVAINYTLAGKSIFYYLNGFSDTYLPKSDATLTREPNRAPKTLGLKVIGSLQGSGKGDTTGQQSNYSDLSASSIRTSIRKNAYQALSSMTPNTTVKGIRYVEGNINLSGSVFDYETLIVKNGNVKITGDLTPKKLGIIVLRDGYSIDKRDYESYGNVYVSSGVKRIDALIYADGGFMSCDRSGALLAHDSATRTSELGIQLVMNGSLFTRNTIGGAILGTSGKYILPGGQITSDFDLAMLYDLNFVRRGNTQNSGLYTDPDYFFVIKYDPSAQTNPPLLFSE